MKDGIEKTYFPTGQLSGEITYRNGKVNGITRYWHRNGTIAREVSVVDDYEHGESKQWNMQGNLLGSYNMVMGTGTARTWHENGRLQGEIDFRKAAFHGRARAWLANGELIAEEYYVSNKKVSKKKYMEMCLIDSTLPKYNIEDVADANDRDMYGASKEDADRHDVRMGILINARDSAEAIEWFSSIPPGLERTLGELVTTGESKKVIEDAYATGAMRVTVAKIVAYPEDDAENSNILIVTLPTAQRDRGKVLKWCARMAEKTGHDAEKDIGQTYVLVMLA